MKFEETLSPNKEDIANLRDILIKYNKQHFETLDQKEFAIFLKDDDEQLIAGISGEIFGNWMEVEYLAVDEKHRGKGLGKNLLERAEKLALTHGCQSLMLYTFGFQGKDFYPKFGYKEVFVKRDFPLTGSEHFFIKELSKKS